MMEKSNESCNELNMVFQEMILLKKFYVGSNELNKILKEIFKIEKKVG